MAVFTSLHFLPLSQVQLSFFSARFRARDRAFTLALHRNVTAAHHAPYFIVQNHLQPFYLEFNTGIARVATLILVHCDIEVYHIGITMYHAALDEGV